MTHIPGAPRHAAGILGMLLGRIRPTALRPVRPERDTGPAGIQAAAIADQVFSTRPDLPLHKAIRITYGRNGSRHPRSDRFLSIPWVHDPHGAITRKVEVREGHLYADAVDDMRRAARWIMREETRRLAILAAGPGHEDPLWGMTASPLLHDMLDRLQLTPGNATVGIDVRMARVIRLMGGHAELEVRGHCLYGTISPRQPNGRPPIRTTTTVEGEQRLEIWAGAIPNTVVDALPGKPLSVVVELGAASADMTIVTAEQDDGSLTLRLDGPMTTLADVPEGIDRRWIQPVEQDQRQS